MPGACMRAQGSISSSYPSTPALVKMNNSGSTPAQLIRPTPGFSPLCPGPSPPGLRPPSLALSPSPLGLPPAMGGAGITEEPACPHEGVPTTPTGSKGWGAGTGADDKGLAAPTGSKGVGMGMGADEGHSANGEGVPNWGLFKALQRAAKGGHSNAGSHAPML